MTALKLVRRPLLLSQCTEFGRWHAACMALLLCSNRPRTRVRPPSRYDTHTVIHGTTTIAVTAAASAAAVTCRCIHTTSTVGGGASSYSRSTWVMYAPHAHSNLVPARLTVAWPCAAASPISLSWPTKLSLAGVAPSSSCVSAVAPNSRLQDCRAPLLTWCAVSWR